MNAYAFCGVLEGGPVQRGVAVAVGNVQDVVKRRGDGRKRYVVDHRGDESTGGGRQIDVFRAHAVDETTDRSQNGRERRERRPAVVLVLVVTVRSEPRAVSSSRSRHREESLQAASCTGRRRKAE